MAMRRPFTQMPFAPPVGAPGDPTPLLGPDRFYSEQIPSLPPQQQQSGWYDPAHTLRNRAVVVKPATPTIISSQNAGRKFVEFTNWSGNADTLWWGDSQTVSQPQVGQSGQSTGLPMAPGGFATLAQQEYDGPIWVITDAAAGDVVVIVSDPQAGV